MSSLLVVPIHLDALFLNQARYATEIGADFIRLPYFDSALGRDINPNTPYLSEAILPRPFQDQRLLLKPGIHLHWSLPDALTHARHDSGKTEFPAVPNRWLITRSRCDSSASEALKQWVVESDVLSDVNLSGVLYPDIPADDMVKKFDSPPTYRFRSLGRRVSFAAWQEQATATNSLKKLTAVGYGEPTFAALYPNCHSVFGFYDGEYDTKPPETGLRYDLLGWYAQKSSDELCRKLQGTTPEYWQQIIKGDFSWTVPESSSATVPTNMVCYAQLTFAHSPSSGQTPPLLSPKLQPENNISVSVGNTATEALAAYLGSLLNGNSESDHLKGIKEEPQNLEELLEALAFADSLEQERLDVDLKLLDARHESTFRSLAPGTLWTIQRQDDNSAGVNAELAQRRQELHLPDSLAQELTELNRLQANYDRAYRELEDLRAQVFADWYKYMLCVYPPETSRESYPDIDLVKYFIETKDIRPIEELSERTGTFGVGDLERVVLPTDTGDTLAHQFKKAYTSVMETLEEINTKPSEGEDLKSKWQLRATAPPRFYLPNEPVILIAGKAATPSERHGQDGRLHPEGLLKCPLVEIDGEISFTDAPSVSAIRKKVVERFANFGEDDTIAISTWQEQPWHPLLLQWEVEFFPTREGNNLTPDGHAYDSGFITQNYDLHEEDVELRIKPDKIPPAKAASVYAGTTILSSGAKPVLGKRILGYLEKHLLAKYFDDKKIPEKERTEDYFNKHRDDILAWYAQGGSDDRLNTLIRVYDQLQTDLQGALSQNLGGFNDALLAHKVTLQTPIDDPIGFEPYRTFSRKQVRTAVGPCSTRAPQPMNDFNPIRAGFVKLLRLRFIDNFGLCHDINVDKVATTRQLSLLGHPNWVAMPPRLAQPARVNFRWLAAETKKQESNSVAETSPVCGWLLPNFLDRSLAVYDQEGRALGALYAQAGPHNDERAQWRATPGQTMPTQIKDIANSHLQKVVTYVQQKGPDGVKNFLMLTDEALAAIDPESSTAHQSLALLVGRPMAVVRAGVNLELAGLPAVNQSWTALRQDLRRSRRTDDNFTKVRFPIRLGEYYRLNDGLVGFWQEDAAHGIDSSPFHAVHAASSATTPRCFNESIAQDDVQPPVIEQTIDAAPQFLTLLMDPRGAIHATSGILPTKSITLPADHYQEALRTIEVSFFTAPILSDKDQLDLPLPLENGFFWSWLQRRGNTWDEVSSLQTIRRTVFVQDAGEVGEALWQQLSQEGWLVSLDKESALVVAPDQRPELSETLKPKEDEIKRLLEGNTVDPARMEAHFPNHLTAREGWLKLRPAPEMKRAVEKKRE